MEATRSQTGFRAIEYVLVAALTMLLLSVYLFGSWRPVWRPEGLPPQCSARIRRPARLKEF